MNWLLAALLAYVGLQLAVGLSSRARVASESDYLVAGRKLGPALVVVLDVRDLVRRGELHRRRGRGVRSSGSTGARADPFGYAGCLFLLGAVFAVPLWRRKLTTLGDLFAWRFGPRRRAARGAADGADLGAVGRGADPRVRAGGGHVVGRSSSSSRSRSRRAS